jgi:hypothetical protein
MHEQSECRPLRSPAEGGLVAFGDQNPTPYLTVRFTAFPLLLDLL